jgi:hypothetical protein
MVYISSPYAALLYRTVDIKECFVFGRLKNIPLVQKLPAVVVIGEVE